jgi:hypothetical protein
VAFGYSNKILSQSDGGNFVTGSGNVLYGCYTTIGGSNNKVGNSGGGSYLSRFNTVFGSMNILQNTWGYYNFVTGYQNKVQGNGVSSVFVAGEGNTANAKWQTIVGKYASVNSSNVFVVGYGENASSPMNIFEVTKTGQARVKGEPQGEYDVIRKQEYDKLVAAIEALGGSVA